MTSRETVRRIVESVIRTIPGYSWIFDVDDLTHDYLEGVYKGKKMGCTSAQIATKVRWLALNKIRDNTRKRSHVSLEDYPERTSGLDAAETQIDWDTWVSRYPKCIDSAALRLEGFGIVEIAERTGQSKSEVHRQLAHLKREYTSQ